jgi:hypothetical protein
MIFKTFPMGPSCQMKPNRHHPDLHWKQSSGWVGWPETPSHSAKLWLWAPPPLPRAPGKALRSRKWLTRCWKESYRWVPGHAGLDRMHVLAPASFALLSVIMGFSKRVSAKHKWIDQCRWFVRREKPVSLLLSSSALASLCSLFPNKTQIREHFVLVPPSPEKHVSGNS